MKYNSAFIYSYTHICPGLFIEIKNINWPKRFKYTTMNSSSEMRNLFVLVASSVKDSWKVVLTLSCVSKLKQIFKLHWQLWLSLK